MIIPTWKIVLIVGIIPHLHAALEGKEYDFEEAVQDQEVTPSMDVEYQTEEPSNINTSWKCGRPPLLGLDLLNGIKRQRHQTKSRQLVPDHFIINGTEVKRGEIPWMVAITKYQPRKIPRWKVVCGGALLNDRYVLTASHCLDGRYKDTLEVVFNADDSSQIFNDKHVIRRKVKRFVMHPEYNSITINNDIALMEIVKPLEISEISGKVWPVCLPMKNYDYSHSIATVSGWGYTDFSQTNKGVQGSPATHLRKVYVPILTHAECLDTQLPNKNNLTENMLCAGYVNDGGKDSCLNDSGGPLTVVENGKSKVVGVVSWGIGCGLKGYPGVYTNVKNYLDWIGEYVSF